jgi:hypothetical protein
VELYELQASNAGPTRVQPYCRAAFQAAIRSDQAAVSAPGRAKCPPYNRRVRSDDSKSARRASKRIEVEFDEQFEAMFG